MYQNKDISSRRKMDHVVMTARRREFCDYKSAYPRNARRAGREVKSLTSPRVIRLGSGEIWLSFNFGSHGVVQADIGTN